MTHDVLVTGAAGFIGSHVSRHLQANGRRVLALDDLSGGFEDQIPDGVTFVRGSVTDSSLLDRLFARNSFAYVFHLAAYAAEGLSPFIRRFNYHNNLIGSMAVLNAAINSRRVKCVVFTSSIAVYGHASAPMSEETVPAPAVELDLAQAHKMFMRQMLHDEPVTIFGDGNQTRAFSDIDDVAPIIAHSIERPDCSRLSTW